MIHSNTSHLCDKEATLNFYEKRYAQGYMDEWPIEKKLRIYEVIRSSKLPDRGEALDFGCGNGILTDVMRSALPPRWKVYGTDISKTAIENAQKRYPECIFFILDNHEFRDKKFSFLFTHHVLEHVYNLSEVMKEMCTRLHNESMMLHILPCGNEGSFEHNLCLLRDNGIDRQFENRFFFEDEGHVRRLTTEQLTKLCHSYGFTLDTEYYSNQYHGAIDWITQSDPNFLRLLTETNHAVNKKAKKTLKKIRRHLFLIWCLRYPTRFEEEKLKKTTKTTREKILLTLAMPLYLFSKPLDNYFKRKSINEWTQYKYDRSGSEMYLFYTR